MTESPTDLSTPAGARLWVEEMKAGAHDIFTKTGDLPPQAIFVTTRDEKTGLSLPQPTLILCFIDSAIINDNEGKNKLGLWLKRIARVTESIGYALLTEAWLLKQDARAAILPSGSWENEPGRIEVVKVQIEHNALGFEHYSAPITRNKKGRGRLGPWEGGVVRDFGGRLAKILPSAPEIATTEQAFDGLIRAGASWTPEKRRNHILNVAERYRAEGMSEDLLRQGIRLLVGKMKEAGQEVAPIEAESRREKMGEVEMVNIDE